MESAQLRYTYENPLANLKLEHYVYRIGSYHYNWHADFELLMVVRGSVEMCVSGQRHILEEDDMVLINPNEGHATLGLGQGNIAMVLHIDPAFFKGYYDEGVRLQLVSTAQTRRDPRFAVIRRCLAQMMVLGTRSDPASRLRYDALFYRLVSAIVPTDGVLGQQTAAYRIDRRGKDAVNRLAAYVEDNYRDRITLADLAARTGYNTSYISQLFKGKLGINAMKAKKHLYDHIVYDSSNERDFATDLDTNADVAVYVKLPDGFYISTPVGHYNPDWAIAFYEGSVKHIYFVAETKGSMNSMQLRLIEESKIHCAREHFKAISNGNVVYDVVDSYTSLMEKVMK